MAKILFTIGWLVFGFLQLDLISTDIQAAETAERSSPVILPIRIPRVFFEGQVQGQIKIKSENSNLNRNYSSPVIWKEEHPLQAPAPQEALADYRDFKGCAWFRDLDSLALCFNVMPDVSSVGVNTKEMQSQGIENFMIRELLEPIEKSDCTRTLPKMNFSKATRNSEQVKIYLSGQIIQDLNKSCQALEPVNQPPEAVNIEIELQSV